MFLLLKLWGNELNFRRTCVDEIRKITLIFIHVERNPEEPVG